MANAGAVSGGCWPELINAVFFFTNATLLHGAALCPGRKYNELTSGFVPTLELIRAINSNTFPMELYGILKDIESLSCAFAFVYFSYVPRLSNAHADSLAKNALRLNQSIL
ncbi:hypothetical protein Bca4012_053317 [Brassica carinata]